MTPADREARRLARTDIVQRVNRFRVWFHRHHRYVPTMLSGRHIQQAVRIARQHRLVTPEVLAAAGFRAEARR